MSIIVDNRLRSLLINCFEMENKLKGAYFMSPISDIFRNDIKKGYVRRETTQLFLISMYYYFFYLVLGVSGQYWCSQNNAGGS